MGALRSIRNGSFEQQQEKAILKTDEVVDEKHDSINSSPEKEKIIPKQEIDKVDKNDDERINISISRKAYDAVEKYTKELNDRESNNQKPFTIEEVLDEEIIFLFSDEWKKEHQ
jgi:TPP-dependent indolepyruvate ferredoxin oxidoreductase alpha subunit